VFERYIETRFFFLAPYSTDAHIRFLAEKIKRRKEEHTREADTLEPDRHPNFITI
jgi:hypothetical protein